MAQPSNFRRITKDDGRGGPGRRRKRGRGEPPKPTIMLERPESFLTKGMIERRKEMEKRNRRMLPPANPPQERIGRMLTGGQAKIAAKAPPRNKIDGKDFAVLRKEKAKGRGMGLQDEKMKPGKIMKADKGGMGEATKYKKYLKGLKDIKEKAENKKFEARRMALAGGRAAMNAVKASRVGKIAAGVAGAALLAKAGLEKMYEKRTGKKPFTKREKKRTLVDKKMGGGMMQRPIMASKGKSVKVKCKLGRNKPTKMY